MRGHLLLARAPKEGKRAPGGFPPDPQKIGRFSFQENRHSRFFPNQSPYNTGARGPREPVGRGAENAMRFKKTTFIFEHKNTQIK